MYRSSQFQERLYKDGELGTSILLYTSILVEEKYSGSRIGFDQIRKGNILKRTFIKEHFKRSILKGAFEVRRIESTCSLNTVGSQVHFKKIHYKGRVAINLNLILLSFFTL